VALCRPKNEPTVFSTGLLPGPSITAVVSVLSDLHQAGDTYCGNENKKRLGDHSRSASPESNFGWKRDRMNSMYSSSDVSRLALTSGRMSSVAT